LTLRHFNSADTSQEKKFWLSHCRTREIPPQKGYGGM
jgi:hypothetical protein